ncbi:MAG: hypothetical protein M5U26_18860 [Planctomycetota bacterium]|nr:hypothetical protein [Planctomycetota bacterium]
MVDLPSREPVEPRIPFSLGYLLAVVAMAVLNAVFFGLLARKYQDPNNPIQTLPMLCVFFGILLAGACNLSASGLVRWMRRREVTDRIVFFLLIEVLGLTLLALTVPYFFKLLWTTG